MTASAARHSTAIRVRPETHDTLRRLAQREHRPLTQVVDRLAAEEWRRVRLQECNEAFARLKRDPAAWAAYQNERRAFEGTLGDGLRDDEVDEEAVNAGEDAWEFVEDPAG